MAEVLSYSNSIVAFVLLVAGIAVTLWSKWVEKNKWTTFAAFLLLGIVAMIFTIASDLQDAATELERDDAIGGLELSMQEQERLEIRNSQLQEEAIELSRELRQLSSETLLSVIGDRDTPPYLYLFDFNISREEGPRVRPYLVNPSRAYAARDCTVSMSFDGGRQATSEAYSVPPDSRVPVAMPGTGVFSFQFLTLKQLQGVGDVITFTTGIACSAGTYVQQTSATKSAVDSLVQRTRVFRVADRSAPIFSKTDDGFPASFAWPELPP
jgi:hypothetical protein